MRILFVAFLGFWLLTGCDSSTTATKTEAPVAASAPVVASGPNPVAIDTTLRLDWEPPMSTDTLLMLSGHHYHLRLQSEMDSTQRLATTYKPPSGPAEKAYGYEGWFTFTLRDSLNRQVFQKRLHKADFYKRVGEIVVVQSGVGVPTLLGYSAPLGALVFTLGFSVPGTDWGGEAVLLLDLKGRVLRMADGDSYGGGPDSQIALSADGRTLLTAYEILRANQPALSLEKPNAELAGAFMLTDTTVATVYELGHWQKKRNAQGAIEDQFVVSPAQKKAPNAFVRHIRTGQVLSRFRYDGCLEALGSIVPRHYLPATRTLYLIDGQKGLLPLPLAAPEAVPVMVPFKAMARFAEPRRPTEARFEADAPAGHCAIYVDTVAPSHFRYQLLPAE